MDFLKSEDAPKGSSLSQGIDYTSLPDTLKKEFNELKDVMRREIPEIKEKADIQSLYLLQIENYEERCLALEAFVKEETERIGIKARMEKMVGDSGKKS